MSTVVVDRELLERMIQLDSLGLDAQQEYSALRAILAQPSETEALMKWKQTAEYWYGQYRLVKHGESPEQYPTEGKLDDWHKSYHTT